MLALYPPMFFPLGCAKAGTEYDNCVWKSGKELHWLKIGVKPISFLFVSILLYAFTIDYS